MSELAPIPDKVLRLAVDEPDSRKWRYPVQRGENVRWVDVRPSDLARQLIQTREALRESIQRHEMFESASVCPNMDIFEDWKACLPEPTDRSG